MRSFRTDGSKEIWNLLMDNRTLESPLTADFAKFQLSPGLLRRRGRKQKGTRLYARRPAREWMRCLRVLLQSYFGADNDGPATKLCLGDAGQNCLAHFNF